MIRTVMMFFASVAAWIAGAAWPAAAQDAMHHAHGPASCAAPGELPPALAGWAAPHTPLTAAAQPGGGEALLVLGQAYDATLQPTSAVQYVVTPGHPGDPGSFGGLFAFDAATPGTYRVALGTHGWADVVDGKQALPSVAHSHGPECTGLAKMVDYIVQPGRHILQIAANDGAGIRLMVVKLP